MNWKKAIESKKMKPGKKKMLTVGKKLIMVGRTAEGELFATEALCRHMRWPLAYGASIKDGCVRCPLHQTTHNLEDGSLVEWSPFPLFPPYGKLVGMMSKKKDLKIYKIREQDGLIEVFL